MIKLAVKDQLGAFVKFDKITLKGLKSVIQGSLYRRLLKLKDQDKISIKDNDTLIKEMIHQLIRGQSLITMASV